MVIFELDLLERIGVCFKVKCTLKSKNVKKSNNKRYHKRRNSCAEKQQDLSVCGMRGVVRTP